MKTISWFSRPSSLRRGMARNFILSPYLSMRSLNYHPSKDPAVKIRFLTFLFLTGFWIVLVQHFMGELSYFEIILFSPAIYFFTEVMGALGQIIFFRKKSLTIHRRPLSALSLSHFWGRDWNIWVQDWLRDVSEGIGKQSHKKKIISVFLVSGLFHELMCNLPYWIFYKKSYFGTMLGYFLIQAMALWIDKKFVKSWPGYARRIYLWTVVILPSPLFINVPLLSFFGLSHE